MSETAVNYCFPLSNNVLAEVIITGDATEKDLDMLQKYLELVREAYRVNPKVAR